MNRQNTTGPSLPICCNRKSNPVLFSGCDTFRAAAIEQIKLWGERPPKFRSSLVNTAADPAAVAHDAVGQLNPAMLHYLHESADGASNIIDQDCNRIAGD